MRTLPFLPLGLSLALAAASTAAHAARPLLPAGGSDQVPTRLAALPAPTGTFEHKPVSFSWALDPTAELAEPAPHAADSREYWLTVDGAQLQNGIDVDLTAPGALIRVSPAAGARRIGAPGLRLASAGKAARLEKLASDEQLQAAGMDVAAGTAIVKVAREHAAGRYQLRADGASGRYVVHVFEPSSPLVLHARADRNHAVAGQSIALDIAADNAGRSVSTQAQALLVAPDGRSFPVAVNRARNGRLTASATLPLVANPAPGLWELQVFANAGGVQRDARTAFAVAQPTARFNGDYATNAQLLRMALPVEAASTGRYEARGTLYATAPDHVLRPVAQAHTAAWFEPGNGMLVLDFDRAHLPAGYGAPFEVRQLELHDQTRLVPLEVRSRGGRF